MKISIRRLRIELLVTKKFMTFIMVKVCHGRKFVKKLVTRVTLFSEFFVPLRPKTQKWQIR